jgi:hypothetical protein
MLWFFFMSVGWGPVVTITVPEIPSDACRQKTVGLTFFCNYVVSLLVSIVSPYIQDQGYGNLGGKITWICKLRILPALSLTDRAIDAFFAVAAVIWVFFEYPETKGRRRESDQLFLCVC